MLVLRVTLILAWLLPGAGSAVARQAHYVPLTALSTVPTSADVGDSPQANPQSRPALSRIECASQCQATSNCVMTSYEETAPGVYACALFGNVTRQTNTTADVSVKSCMNAVTNEYDVCADESSSEAASCDVTCLDAATGTIDNERCVCACALGFSGADCSYIEPLGGDDVGDWISVTCPSGYFVSGVTPYNAHYNYDDCSTANHDQLGVYALTVHCTDPNTGDFVDTVTSFQGEIALGDYDYTWDSFMQCLSNEYMVGIQLNWGNRCTDPDDLSAIGHLALQCRRFDDATVTSLEGDELYDITRVIASSQCPLGTAVCELLIRGTNGTTSQDSRGVTDVHLHCCHQVSA